MMYEYDLTPVEVDSNMIEDFSKDIIGWTNIDPEDIVEQFAYDAEERIENHIRDLDELQEADEEEIDMVVAEAVEADVEEVALEIARDFVEALAHDLSMTYDRLEDNIQTLDNMY